VSVAERLRFGRERARPSGFALGASIVAFALAAIALGWSRAYWMPGPAPAGPLFEIRGDVPRPGVHAVAPATLHALLAAAGAPTEGPDRPLVPGEVVVVRGGAVETRPADDPLIVGLPVDPNTASVEALDAIPGVSTGVAEAIVAERAAHGPYRSLEALRRAPGVRDEVLAALAPFVAVTDPGPIDVNRASAGELETLPGIGPTLARRIVEDRIRSGPFRELAELRRVDGVGDALVAGLDGLAVAR
jgi:competence protein ComEA